MPFKVARESIQKIQKANIVIHPYTFRKDTGVLPDFKNDSKLEENYFLCCLGVDGLFTEFPDQTREIISTMKLLGVSKAREEVGVDGESISVEKLDRILPVCSIDCQAY